MNRLLVAACVATLGLAGCTSDEPDSAPPTPAERPAVDLPKDRDERAVVAALRQTDMCALLGAASADAGTGNNDTLSAPTPSACEMSVEPSGDIDLKVATLSSDQRLILPSATFGGAKAYIDLGVTADSCDIYFPVSFQLALLLRVEESSCEYAKKVATGIATTLTDPAWTPAEPRWGACDVLRSIPGTDLGRIDAYTATQEAMDSCADMKSLATLDLVYPKFFPDNDATRTEIGGVEVWAVVNDNPESPSCTLEWAPRQSEQLVVRLRAQKCAQLEPLVKPVNDALRQPPPKVSPQQPLLYRPDEPDRPSVGACAFAANGTQGLTDNCAPHTDVPVPAGDGLVPAAASDPDVACALASDAVTKHFGKHMEAVTVWNGLKLCYFVEPERLIQLEFHVSSLLLRNASIDEGQEINIAGHPGYVSDLQPAPSYRQRFAVATSKDSDQPGRLELSVTKGPVSRTVPSDEAISKTESALSDIVREHFSE